MRFLTVALALCAAMLFAPTAHAGYEGGARDAANPIDASFRAKARGHRQVSKRTHRPRKQRRVRVARHYHPHRHHHHHRSAGKKTYAKVVGPTRGLHPRLRKRLNGLSRHYGRTVRLTPHGGCRKHGSRAAPRSYHKRSRGCRAADVRISGVRGRAILAYWKRTGGGGRGAYCGRSFVHVDIGPSRTWYWRCKKKRRGRRA